MHEATRRQDPLGWLGIGLTEEHTILVCSLTPDSRILWAPFNVRLLVLLVPPTTKTVDNIETSDTVESVLRKLLLECPIPNAEKVRFQPWKGPRQLELNRVISDYGITTTIHSDQAARPKTAWLIPLGHFGTDPEDIVRDGTPIAPTLRYLARTVRGPEGRARGALP
jgi:hypothetical protein